MSKLAELQALAAQAAETGPNMTEVQKGGNSRVLPAGYAFGRLVEYIELGAQPQEFQGKAKDPKHEAMLGFALWGEGYQNEDGTPYIIRPYSFTIDRNEKARAFKLFRALNWKGTSTHFAQLLGEAFLVKIVHVAKSKTDATIVSRIDLDGFLPPLDPVTRQPYGIPAPRDEDLGLFLWDYPTLAGWDALYVDGTWDDGKSKNRLQETIIGALDFAGSALEALLMQSNRAVQRPAPAAATPAPAVPAAPAVALPTVPAVPFVQPSPPAPIVVPQQGTDSTPNPGALPVSPTTQATSPSSPAMPNLPVMPALPALPAIPALPKL